MYGWLIGERACMRPEKGYASVWGCTVCLGVYIYIWRVETSSAPALVFEYIFGVLGDQRVSLSLG